MHANYAGLNEPLVLLHNVPYEFRMNRYFTLHYQRLIRRRVYQFQEEIHRSSQFQSKHDDIDCRQ